MSLQSIVANALTKQGDTGSVEVKSSALNSDQRVQTAKVSIYIIDRVTTPANTTEINAVMSATKFPVQGGTVTVGGRTYDIAGAQQIGVGTKHLLQKVVLHER